jgi:hypothetical protein
MKHALIALAIIALGANAMAVPHTVKIAWDAPTNNTDGTPLTDLASYNLYRGAVSGSYPIVTNVGNTTTTTVHLAYDHVWSSTNYAITLSPATWTVIPATAVGVGTSRWYFVSTAINSNQVESEYSSELLYDIPSNITYWARWGKAPSTATNPIAGYTGGPISGGVTAYPRTTLYIKYGVIGGPDFPSVIPVPNYKPSAPRTLRVAP